MYRIVLKCGQEVISTTCLTSRILRRSGHPIEIIEQPDREDPHDRGFSRFDWEDPVATKQEILDNWESWSGEDIVERLDCLRSIQKADVPKSDLDQTLDLWLLTALAQEKSLYFELREIEETYHHCRHLGKWNAVLVRNNLAVLKAKRNDCLDSLNLLTEAISLSLANQFNSKAPFYNAALIFRQLHKTGLLADPRYLDVLNQIASIIGTLPDQTANEDPEQSDANRINHSRDPGDAYRRIAEFGFYLNEPKDPDLFHRNISYLTPDFDLFESFGDFPDKIDSRTAHDFLEKGIVLTDEEKYDEGIRNFELARQFDPAFSSESNLRVEQVSDQWRQSENQRLSNYLSLGEYNKASDVILTLDERLKRDNDWTVVSSIQKLKHRAAVRDADRFYEAGDAESRAAAKAGYIGVLREEDLTDSLRVYVSTRLVTMLYDCPNDRDRHRKLTELILSRVHPDVVNRFSDQLAQMLMREAQAHLVAGGHETAIEKCFWAMLLPNQTKRRDELFQSALFALNHLLEGNQKLSDSASLQDPLFSELITELTDRWDTEQDKQAAAKFERLDSEPLILKKQIDELLALLDQLSERAPTTDRLVDKLRLPREREAQKLFGSIQEQIKLVSKEGDHSRRREVIQGDLRKLHKLAADFAGGNRAEYSRQITDFVLKAEEYLLDADQQQFMNEMDLEISDRNEKQFIELREMLRGDADELTILQTFGATLRQLQETRFFSQIQELAVHWFEKQAKRRYRALMVNDPNRAREILRGSLESLEMNEKVLPQELNVNFRRFLQELLEDLDPRTQPEPEPVPPPTPGEPSPPPPPASETRSSAKGFLRQMVDWIKSVFGSRRQS